MAALENRYLGIYLNDHLAGSALGLELAKRCLRSNQGTPFGAFLERLAGEIDSDRHALIGVMEALGVRRSPLKQVAAVVAERAGRLKLNGRLIRYSPLSRLVELEGLTLGVTGKRALWRALRELEDDRLGPFAIDELERRADEQLAELERRRLQAAALAFR